MGDPGRALTRLGRRVAEEQDEHLGRLGANARGRERLLAALPLRSAGRPAARPRPLLRTAFALAAAAAVAFCLLLVVLGRRPLTFRVGAGEAAYAGVPGAWIATSADRSLAIAFSDGTHLEVEPESKVRVASVQAKGGRVVIENGALRAAIVHRDEGRWLIDSGPFEVLVTGTRFHVGWDLVAERFTLHLGEGSVLVSGPIIGDGLAVRAGDVLRVFRRENRFELRRDGSHDSNGGEVSPPESPTARAPAAPAAADRAEPAADEPTGSEPAGASPTATLPAPRGAALPAPLRHSWRELAASGKYGEAVEAAEREGFRRIGEEASAADLRALGDAARLAGNAGRAVEVFTALRRRFPADEEAAHTAFILGIIAFDKQGAHAESARWLATYLRERPRGPLAREATGRLVEALDRSGNKAGARETAQRYLRDYPRGPHADLARRVAGE